MPVPDCSFVCCECRTAVRSRQHSFPLCSACGKVMTCIGRYHQIPKKKDAKGWRKLMKRMAEKRVRCGHTLLSRA